MNDYSPADPKLKFHRNMCRCPSCGKHFNSVSAFEKHRIGPPENRRCLTRLEMENAGMSVNKRDYWITEAMPEKARDSKRR